MKPLAWLAQIQFLALFALVPAKAAPPDYSIQAIHYASSVDVPVAELAALSKIAPPSELPCD